MLLLCEHPACATSGTENRCDPEVGPKFESQRGFQPVYTVNRGGGHIEHGPGQLGIYPVISLLQTELTPFGFRGGLESLVANVCSDLFIPNPEAIPGTGVECNAGLVGRTAIQVQHEISQAGLYLNVNQVYPLGSVQESTSLVASTMKRIPVSMVKSRLISHFADWLGSPILATHTTHPLLRRVHLTQSEVGGRQYP